jgi:hypothetical protein
MNLPESKALFIVLDKLREEEKAQLLKSLEKPGQRHISDYV